MDPDVAARLKELSHSRKISFKQALNETLRQGLDQRFSKPKAKPFHTEPENMGVLPHLNYDNIGDLLEVAEKASKE